MNWLTDTVIATRFKGVNDESNMFDWHVELLLGKKSHHMDIGLGFGHCRKAKSHSAGAVKTENKQLARAVSPGGKLVVADLEKYVVPTPPSLTTALQMLQNDARSGEHLLFEDFASEFGYDQDSRAAEKIWRACQEIRGRLQKFFGADFDAFINHDFDAQD
jgi:hypothetical protein